MFIHRSYVGALSVLGVGLAFLGGMAAPASAVVIVPDNGAGTATVPPPTGTYVWDPALPPFSIINGLPPGTTVQSIPSAEWGVFTYGTDVPGGALGGNHQTFTAPLTFHLVGSGTLLGYTRTVAIPTSGQTDTAPRGAPFSSPQSFNTDLTNLQGQISGAGDPDFDLLRVTAGTNFGLPSPGHTTLTAAGGGTWQVDSFFDITYRIDFVGHPGGPFGGMSGSTTGTTRMVLGSIPAPTTATLLGLGGLALARRRRA